MIHAVCNMYIGCLHYIYTILRSIIVNVCSGHRVNHKKGETRLFNLRCRCETHVFVCVWVKTQNVQQTLPVGAAR